MFVLDSHCDTPSQILKFNRDLSLDNNEGHVDFPKLSKAGVNASFFALYVPPQMETEEAFAHAGAMLEATRKAVAANGDKAAFACSAAQARENAERGLFSIMLGLENASPIGTDISRFEWFREQGIRYITLCHNADNLVCDSAAGSGTNNGLSSFGRELVRRMNETGVIVDCAHISDKSFYDVVRYSKCPVVSTHSCCRALAGHRRNMTDDMIKALADNGGVIQINFYPVFLQDGCSDDGPSCPYTRIVDHIDHAVEVAGIGHVGIGSDFDGIDITPYGMEDVSKLPLIFDEMRSRGYSESDIAKVAGENFLRVLATAESAAISRM